MSELSQPMRPLRTQRARPLRGTFAVPGDPTVAMRALLIAAMARGESRILNLPRHPVVAAMAAAIVSLGARGEAAEGGVTISGLGVGGLLEPNGALDLLADDDLAALLLGAVGIYPFETRFAGSGRPVGALLNALEALGIVIDWNGERRGPLALRGPRTPVPGPYPAGSDAARTALLLATTSIPGITTITARRAAHDHTERMLEAFGANIEWADDEEGVRTIRIEGLPDLGGRDLLLPGNPTGTAVGIVAGLVTQGAEIEVDGVLLNPARTLVVDVLTEMGADLAAVSHGRSGGEDVARIAVRQTALGGLHFDAERTAALADELPMLLVAASFARGDTVIKGLPEDSEGWIAEVTAGFTANGVQWRKEGDTLIVHGQGRVTGGGTIAAPADPRTALVFLMMGMATRDPITVMDHSGLEGRYPGVLNALTALGASFREERP